MGKAILSAVDLENINNTAVAEYMDCVRDIFYSDKITNSITILLGFSTV